jgi:hypothetical protein
MSFGDGIDDETDIDFPATDLTPALHTLCFRMLAIVKLNNS